jgi:hypothetical protein
LIPETLNRIRLKKRNRKAKASPKRERANPPKTEKIISCSRGARAGAAHSTFRVWVIKIVFLLSIEENQDESI